MKVVSSETLTFRTNFMFNAWSKLGLIFDGELYPSDKYIEFANLPSKEESLTKMLMMFNQPITKLASTLNGSFGKLLSVLNSLKDTKE